jgi:hypothetical protein
MTKISMTKFLTKELISVWAIGYWEIGIYLELGI